MSNTPRPKSIALMFLLGAFLTGSAVGYAADRAFSSTTSQHQNSEVSMRDSLAKELRLSGPQRHLVDSILDWGRGRRNEIMKPVIPTLRAERDSARALILQALDGTQQARFRSILERMRVNDSASRAREDRK